jgi:hypothetical protein
MLTIFIDIHLYIILKTKILKEALPSEALKNLPGTKYHAKSYHVNG